MRNPKSSFSINLIPPKEGPKSGRWLGVAGIGFILGAMLTILGLSSALGTEPLALFNAGMLDKLVIQKTPSERLIAQGSVIDVAKKVQPAIVGIEVRTKPKTELYHGIKTQGHEAQSVGSGVVMRSDGYIMTNNHVVKDAGNILVTIGDDKVPAEVVGVDPNSDIAVIKVRKADLTVARFGAAKSLQVGELAVAIGSPFGFQHSVTAGVISALNRNVTVGGDIDRPKTYTNLIQTDAAINPGNSGGALINQKGEVVGINTLIYSTNGVSQGIGFAIPVETAQRVADDLIDRGHVQYPFIGIEGQTVDPGLAKTRDLSVDQGAVVVKIFPGGPAEAAGIKVGDVIVGFGETKIGSMDDLVAAVRLLGVGKTISIRVSRQGAEEVLTIKTTEKPASF